MLRSGELESLCVVPLACNVCYPARRSFYGVKIMGW